MPSPNCHAGSKEGTPPLGTNAISIFDLFWRDEHDSPISPLRDGIAGPLVISDGFLNSASGRIKYAAVKQLIGDALCFQLSFRWNLVAHTSHATRSIRPH